MSSNVVPELLKLCAAMSVAVGLCALLRKPLRQLFGARAAYWIWLLVPVSALAVLAPAPAQPLHVLTRVLPAATRLASLIDQAQLRARPARDEVALLIAALWALGALLAAAIIMRAQWRFRRGLEPLHAGPDATLQSAAIEGPMLVGTWRPRVVLPLDFTTRYDAGERALVLAHEYAHLRRHDALMNACAAATLCLNWFNPLLYWALGRFRFDQELACDADVLARTGARRRSYADALLKTHLAGDSRGESRWLIPVGCPWQPTHPLTERIAMLKLPLPGTLRRRVGAALVVVVIGSAGYACWAAQSVAGPARLLRVAAATGAPIALHMKWTINDADTAPARASEVTRKRTVLVFNLVARAGNVVTLFNPDKTLAARCTPSLAGPAEHGKSNIFVECTLTDRGEVLGNPSVMIADGTTAAIQLGEGARRHLSRLEITASTQPRNVAALSEDDAKVDADDVDVDDVDADDMEVDVPDVDAPGIEAPEPPEAPVPALPPVPAAPVESAGRPI